MDTLDLSELFNTRQQAVDFSTRLTLVLKQIFAKDFNPDKVLLAQFGIEKKDALMTLMRNNNVNAQSRLDIKAFLEKIQQKMNSLQVISIIIAFEPKESTLKAFSQWFFVNLNRQVLLDVKIDRNLIAGAAILSNGKYLDFSIKEDFDKSFKKTFVRENNVKPS